MLNPTKFAFRNISNNIKKTVSASDVVVPSVVTDTVELSKKKSLTKKVLSKLSILKLAVIIFAGVMFMPFQILMEEMKKPSTISFEKFQQKGGKLDKTKATYKWKNFTGNITRELGEKNILLVYKGGLLQKSIISHQDSKNRYEIVKEYNHDSNENLTDVSVSTRNIPLSYLADLSKLPLWNTVDESFIKQKNLGKVEFTPNEIRCFVPSSLTQDIKNRSNLSDQEVIQECQKILNKIFLGQEFLMPNLNILYNTNENYGGHYLENLHTIKINADAYRNGFLDLADIVAHEAHHSKQAILRARLPQNKKEQIIQDVLCSRILNHDADAAIYSCNFFEAKTVKPPKMPEEMKKEFAQFAKNSLYLSGESFITSILNLADETVKTDLDTTQKKFLEKIKEFVHKYPDFVSQFQDENEAINDLKLYAISHVYMYNVLTSPSRISFDLPKLSLQEEEKAIDSVVNYVSEIEGSMRRGSFLGQISPNESDHNNYQFAKEEVQAQFAGAESLISHTKQRLEQLRKEGKLTSALEQNLNHTIERAKKRIEYKAKGYEWYQKYTQLQSEPENIALREEVEKDKLMLDEIKPQLDVLIPNGTYRRIKPKT